MNLHQDWEGWYQVMLNHWWMFIKIQKKKKAINKTKKQVGNIIHWGKVVTVLLINQRSRLKNILYDSLGIFCETYLFYLFAKNDFESGLERKKKKEEGRKEEKRKKTEEWEIRR